RAPLSVRISDGSTDLHVTSRVEGLRFTKTAPGGHESASMRVRVPAGTFTDLGPADRVYVYDARTGATVWEGYTENPGATRGLGGEEYDLSAMGGKILASDQSVPLLFRDTTYGHWQRYSESGSFVASSTTAVDPNPTT